MSHLILTDDEAAVLGWLHDTTTFYTEGPKQDHEGTFPAAAIAEGAKLPPERLLKAMTALALFGAVGTAMTATGRNSMDSVYWITAAGIQAARRHRARD